MELPLLRTINRRKPKNPCRRFPNQIHVPRIDDLSAIEADVRSMFQVSAEGNRIVLTAEDGTQGIVIMRNHKIRFRTPVSLPLDHPLYRLFWNPLYLSICKS
jgi:hypothetical protein